MPIRATKRGSERTALDLDADVLVCGASFAGLAVALRLSGAGKRVIVVDRYEIGERQTSACGIPTGWLEALDLMSAHQQTFSELVVHTPHTTARLGLPWSFSTFDYRTLCERLADRVNADEIVAETATVQARTAAGVRTDRGEIRAPIVVDALGWRRVLADTVPIQPPDAYLSRGLEVHPEGSGDELEIWIDRDIIPAGYGWSFPADCEVRVGVGSFVPRDHVKVPTVRLAESHGWPARGYQGNWIPHRIREATENGIFFVGDSAGHCLPLTAEGIRTALYFGLAAGREIRRVLDGEQSREAALAAYGAFSAAHRWKFEWMLRVQNLVPRVPPRLLAPTLQVTARPRVTNWAFNHYLEIAHPRSVAEDVQRGRSVGPAPALAATSR